MAIYDPPAHTVPTFNPNLFTGIRYSANNAFSAPTEYLEFPVAQGAETFNYTANGNSVTLSEDGIAVLGGEFTTPFGIAFNNLGFEYDNGSVVNTISWETLQTKVAAVAPLSQAPNATTLAVNNAISIQNGETVDPPLTSMVLSAEMGINTLSLDGDKGTAGLVLTSGGPSGTLYWGTGSTPGSVGTLADVLTNGNIANMNIDMAGYDISGVNQVISSGGVVVENTNGIGALYDNNLNLQATGGTLLEIQADASANLVINGPTLNTANLTAVNESLPININGTIYYLQLFNSP
jgi:hypothetical protein